MKGLENEDQNIVYCSATNMIAQELGPYLKVLNYPEFTISQTTHLRLGEYHSELSKSNVSLLIKGIINRISDPALTLDNPELSEMFLFQSIYYQCT